MRPGSRLKRILTGEKEKGMVRLWNCLCRGRGAGAGAGLITVVGDRERGGRVSDEFRGHLGCIVMGLVGVWISYQGQWGLLEGYHGRLFPFSHCGQCPTPS